MTPDGTPIIGKASEIYNNVWLNTGHGTLGWTMACGSAQVLADLVANQQPAIHSDDLALSRYTIKHYNLRVKNTALQTSTNVPSSQA